jgi:soluble lytic murein transglycosylase
LTALNAKPSIEPVKARYNLPVIGLALVVLLSACGSNNGDETPVPTPEPTAVEEEARSPLPTPAPIVGLDGAQQALRDGRFEAAAAAFEAFADEGGGQEEQASAYLGAGVAWHEAGEPERSIQALRRAHDAAPADSQLRRRSGYLLATRLREAGASEQAANVLQPLYAQPHDDVLQPYIDAAFASAAAQSGHRHIAEDAWDRALAAPDIPRSLETSILRERAQSALRQGDRSAAGRWMSQLAGAVTTTADRFLLAQIAIALDNEGLWADQLRQVIEDSPGTADSLRAIELLEKHRVDVDGGLVGFALYRARQYGDAREVLYEALDEPGITPEDRTFRTYYLAASYDDDGMHAEAIPLYDEAAEHAPWSPFAHRAKYWAARAAELMDDNGEAARRHRELALNGPHGEFTGESTFRAGFLLLEEGDPAGAVETWEVLDLGDDGRALYWKGRAQEELGNTPQAETAYREAQGRDPLSFHGMEAARRLGDPVDDDVTFEPLEPPGEPDWDEIAAWLTGVEDATAPLPLESAANELASMGIRSHAREIIREAEAEPLARLRAAWELQLTDLVAREATRIINDSGLATANAPRSLLQLAYPVDYVVLLNELGARYDVDPLFLASIIRVESFWERGAVSIAGARGLTQVMPATGEDIAVHLGADGWTVDDLFRPVVSLEFGAFYIARQLDSFGNPYHALAAYNGGAGNAIHWAEAAAGGSPADFVEHVTFNETQRYVRYVMSAYAHYRHAYRGER